MDVNTGTKTAERRTMPRLFVAIDLPEEIQDLLAPLCLGLPGARWVPREQLHLTLRFIGEIDGGLSREIDAALEDIRSPPFIVRLAGLGHFPPRKMPRVIWVGVEPREDVIALRNRVESTLIRIGLEPEGRRFSPHVTLARLKNPPLSKVTRYLAGNALFTSPGFSVPEFHLYASTLTSKGAIHEKLATYPLRI